MGHGLAEDTPFGGPAGAVHQHHVGRAGFGGPGGTRGHWAKQRTGGSLPESVSPGYHVFPFLAGWAQVLS